MFLADKVKKLALLFFLPAFVLFLPAAIFAQNSETAESSKNSENKNETVEIRHNSKLMKREMPYRIIFPAQYKTDKKERFPVIYLLHGRVGHYNDWTDKAKIAEYSTAYNFIIVMPEGGSDGWYSDSAVNPNDKYESYLIRELIPEIDEKYRTIANREHRIVAGLSMGGYGALKFGLKYAEKFVLAGSFSGALDSVVRTEKYSHLIGSVKGVFGDTGSKARQENDIFRIVGEASPEKIREFSFFYIVCGTQDHQFQSNRDFVELLLEKKVPHEYRQMPGAHNWEFWDREVREFLRVASRIVLQKK